MLSGVCTTTPRISPMNRPLGHHPDGLSPLLTSARYDAGGDYSFLVAWPDRASSDSEPATHTPKWETGQPRPAPPADGQQLRPSLSAAMAATSASPEFAAQYGFCPASVRSGRSTRRDSTTVPSRRIGPAVISNRHAERLDFGRSARIRHHRAGTTLREVRPKGPHAKHGKRRHSRLQARLRAVLRWQRLVGFQLNGPNSGELP